MVHFEEHFWGEKNNGYSVLHQNFKHEFYASKEFSEFLKERSNIEETYAKSLLKLATKCSASNSQVGSFEPCWKFLQSSTEKLANVHSQIIQKLNEVNKACKEHGEQHKEKMKQMKDQFSSTSDAVQSFTNLTAELLKAKEAYQLRSQEVEKIRSEFPNLKEVKNAETKFKKSCDDYKQSVEKREKSRKVFRENVTEISKKLQNFEEEHLSQMLDILSKYGETIKLQKFLLEQIIDEFAISVSTLNAENLLQQFINLNQTGKEIPETISFEEIELKSKAVDLDAIAQALKEEKRRKKEEKRQKRTERIGLRRRKKEKTTVNGSVEKVDSTADTENDLQLDEEGYVIRKPDDSESIHSSKSKDSFSSDSETDSDDDRQKIQVRIKPVEESKGSNSDLSEEQLKKLSATLTLISPASMLEKRSVDEKKFVSIWGSHNSLNALSSKSRSNNDLLSIDKNSDSASLHSLPINSAISGIDLATPTSSSSASDVRANNDNTFEANFASSPINSPELTSSVAGSSKISPAASFEESLEDSTRKLRDDPPPLPLKSRSMSIRSTKSNSSEHIEDSKENTNDSFDNNKFSTNNSFDEDKKNLESNKPSDNSPQTTASSTAAPSTEVQMFTNALFEESFSNQINFDKTITTATTALSSTTTTSTTTSSKSTSSGLERLNPPPPPSKKLSAPTALPSRTLAVSGSSLPRPKPGQLAPPPSIPRRNTVSATSTTNNTQKQSSISDLLEINFSSVVQPLSPIKDSSTPEMETTTSHWINPEENTDPIEPVELQTPIKPPDTTSPPLIPRRDTFPLQTPVASTQASSVVLPPTERAIPIAVAFIETVNGLFKGSDEKSCVIRVTGDMTVSFPANIITMLSTNASPPVLSFIVTGTASVEQIFPNKALVERVGQLPNGEGITYKFNMPALAAYLKKQAEQGAKASYYNIDIIKYQVRCNGMASAPLQLSAYWRCDEEQTDLKIDYLYNSACMSSSVSLNNVNIVVPVDGGVTIMQSKPTAIWSSEHQRCMWRLAAISSDLDQSGSTALRARFDVSSGPTNPAPISVQFTGESSTISLLNFDLTSPSYKLSLVKKRFTSGKYVVEQ